jgi:hypothetical protein
MSRHPVQIQIDGVVYTAIFQSGFDNQNPLLQLGPDFARSCLVIGRIDSEAVCNITPRLPSHGVLDILVPLAIEICLQHSSRVEDAARIVDGHVWLSLMKIMTGSSSTAYSKYGFYSQDLPQSEIDRQSKFFLSQSGLDTPLEFQQKLTLEFLSIYL